MCKENKCFIATIISVVLGILVGILIYYNASLVTGPLILAIVMGLGFFFLVQTLLCLIGLLTCLITWNCPRKKVFCKNDEKCD